MGLNYLYIPLPNPFPTPSCSIPFSIIDLWSHWLSSRVHLWPLKGLSRPWIKYRTDKNNTEMPFDRKHCTQLYEFWLLLLLLSSFPPFFSLSCNNVIIWHSLWISLSQSQNHEKIGKLYRQTGAKTTIITLLQKFQILFFSF